MVRRIVGRRGSTQASFTIKELRELTKLPGARLVTIKAELAAGDNEASVKELTDARALQRKRTLLDECAVDEALAAGDGLTTVAIRFLRNPVEFKPRADDPTRLGSVVLERCELSGPPGSQRAVGTGDLEEVPCALALVSVGYIARPPTLEDGRSLPTRGPSGALRNEGGRVDGVDKLYCAGWVKRGPSGIIGSNIGDARETVATLMSDLVAKRGAPADDAEYATLLSSLSAGPTTSWEDWQALNAQERKAGEPVKAPRLKVPDVDTMLRIIGKKA